MGGSSFFQSSCWLLIAILQVQLLHKLSIRGVNGSEKLLRVIRVRRTTVADSLRDADLYHQQNPVTEHFPVNTVKISMLRDLGAPTLLTLTASAVW